MDQAVLAKQAYHVNGFRALTTSVAGLLAVATEEHTLFGAVDGPVAFLLAVTTGVGGL